MILYYVIVINFRGYQFSRILIFAETNFGEWHFGVFRGFNFREFFDFGYFEETNFREFLLFECHGKI